MKVRQTLRLQLEKLRLQLQVARQTGLPLVLHLRGHGKITITESWINDRAITELQAVVPKTHRVHVHCFTGDLTMCKAWTKAFYGVGRVICHCQIRRDCDCRSLAFPQLLLHIEECKENEDVKIFKLASLCKTYDELLQQLGETNAGRIHSTRLKEKILANMPDMKAHADGHNVFLSFDVDIARILQVEMAIDCDEEAAALSLASKIIRRDIISRNAVPFRGTFDLTDHANAIPRTHFSSSSEHLCLDQKFTSQNQ